jgi:hypothetical protein
VLKEIIHLNQQHLKLLENQDDAKNIYIKNEAKNNFKGWSKKGLEFLLLYPFLSKTIKQKIKSKLKREK